MDEFIKIEDKLHQFTKKYYKSELIKGVILFISLGFLYLFFTLFIEYFLWLKPTARTILFWLFLIVEVFLLITFIAIPIFKLLGLRKGISFNESSKMIGNHFPEVKDKLLNVLQLKENSNQSDLLLASIHQKSEELSNVPFVKAVDFKENKTYLKYAILPVLIFLITLFTGNKDVLTDSLDRVVHHRTSYIPPAPFNFYLNNSNLNVVEGKSITVTLQVKGNVLPNEAEIYFDNQQYYTQNLGNGIFSYTFTDVKKATDFYVAANGIQSETFSLNVINTPTITNISLDLNYPNYLNKKNKIINNSGDIIVPEGTTITWLVDTYQTSSLTFLLNKNKTLFTKESKNKFKHKAFVTNPINYQINSSNTFINDFESLQFSVDVVKDESPIINVNSNIDSISRGKAQFAGKISDDYGITKLQLVCYDVLNSDNKQVANISILKNNFQTFFYEFPDGLNLEDGVNYEMYFEVFDNDAVNGHKKTRSKTFNYKQKNKFEVEEELLQEQKNTLNALQNSIDQQKKEQRKLNKVQKDLQTKKDINWNDKKKIKKFIEKQEQYNKMMQRQTDKLQENLDEKKSVNKEFSDKKEELKKRIEELKKSEKQEKLLKEIDKLADKLKKDDLLKKAKELAQHNKQQERSLERILELTKRFYIEQKASQLATKIEELSKKQDKLSKKEDQNLESQKEIKKEFDKIKKELENLDKDNQQLKKPMDLPDVDEEKESIDEELKKAEENISQQKSSKSQQNQKNASKKMKEMSAKMQSSILEMQGDSMEENMDDLRKILENLVTFSFTQETLMDKFSESSTGHPDFGKDLKKQNEIKTYFEHIDDSLYVLSLRVPKISTKINENLSTAHFNLEQSLENFSENRFSNGVSNQRYVMTSVNSLSDYLSNMLDNMKNSMSMKSGKGKKKKGNGFSLPDLIKKQEGLSKKMKEGMKQGNKPGEKSGKGETSKQGKQGKKGTQGIGSGKGKNRQNKGKGNNGTNDDLDGELYKIYKEQSLLRQALESQIKESQESGNGSNLSAKKALKKMEDLESEILEKGFNAATLQKMQQLNYELLKLDKAKLEQGKDKKRKSNTNTIENKQKNIKALEFKKLYYNQNEILNRQSLPLHQNFKRKVREYFSDQK